MARRLELTPEQARALGVRYGERLTEAEAARLERRLADHGTSAGAGTVSEGYVSPWVARVARKLGVDVSSVTGSGERGRVLLSDVHAAARRQRPDNVVPLDGAKSQRPARQGAEGVTEAARTWMGSRNNLGYRYTDGSGTGTTAHIAVAQADWMDTELTAARARRRAPETTVSFTASGLDPAVLREVPPSVRRALAAAETTSEARRLVDTYGPMSDEQARTALSRDRKVSARFGGGSMAGIAWPMP